MKKKKKNDYVRRQRQQQWVRIEKSFILFLFFFFLFIFHWKGYTHIEWMYALYMYMYLMPIQVKTFELRRLRKHISNPISRRYMNKKRNTQSSVEETEDETKKKFYFFFLLFIIDRVRTYIGYRLLLVLSIAIYALRVFSLSFSSSCSFWMRNFLECTFGSDNTCHSTTEEIHKKMILFFFSFKIDWYTNDDCLKSR